MTANFQQINETEIDIRINGEYFRVSLINRTQGDRAEFSVALPWGRTFNQAYKYQFSFKAHRAGRQTIEKAYRTFLYTTTQSEAIDCIYKAIGIIKSANKVYLSR